MMQNSQVKTISLAMIILQTVIALYVLFYIIIIQENSNPIWYFVLSSMALVNMFNVFLFRVNIDKFILSYLTNQSKNATISLTLFCLLYFLHALSLVLTDAQITPFIGSTLFTAISVVSMYITWGFFKEKRNIKDYGLDSEPKAVA